MNKQENPKQTYDRLYDEFRYGVEIHANGCRIDDFICPIVTVMNDFAVNKCIEITAKVVIKETLEEYTNDENHERVLHWKEVEKLASLKLKEDK